MRVDDPANGLVGELSDHRKKLIASRTEPGIDDEHAVRTDLQRHVAPVAGDHVDAAANRQHLQIAGGAAC
jgi:hypothetical protein